jgi:hypothetical protein
VGATDTCSFRRFDIATTWTLPASEGGNGFCTSCYDHYGANLPAGPSPWTLRTYNFTALSRRMFLSPPTLPTTLPIGTTAPLFLDYRADFVKLVFQHGRNNVAGTSPVDYAVDQFEFF